MYIYTTIHDACREEQNIDLPNKGKYATGIVYLEKLRAAETEAAFEKEAEEDGLRVLCWRTVPTDSTFLGNVARSTEPFMRQVRKARIFGTGLPIIQLLISYPMRQYLSH